LPAKPGFKNTRLAVNDQTRPDDRSDGHLHAICSCKEGHDLGLIWRNIKSFTAIKLIDAVINNIKESRKEYLPHTFAGEGKKVAVIINTSFGNTKIIRYYWTVQRCITSV